MDKELSALHKTSTWDLVPLPLGKSVVGCHWVYKIKTNFDGSSEGFKGDFCSCCENDYNSYSYISSFGLTIVYLLT